MDDVRVSIVASSRYIQVLREDGSQLSRHVTIEDAIESAVNAGPGRYRVVYPERSIEVSKAYGTLPGSGTPPAAPAGLFQSDSTAAYVGLGWDDPGGVSVWTVYRDGVALGTTAYSGYFDATVVPEAQYVYQVQATNTAGSSALSDGLSVTVPANSPPYWTEDPQTLYVGQGFTLDLTTLATDDDGHDLTFSVVTGAVPGLALAGDNYSGAPTAVGVYDVTFSASDGYASTAGTIAFTVLDPDVTAPDPPTGLAAAVAGSTVTLTWNAASDPSGLSSYRVRRNGAYLATVSPPVETYVDAGVPDGTYTYTVRAADASANVNVSADSDPVVAVVSAAPLDAPTSFTATSSTSTQADLSWVPGPNGPVPTGYELQRSVNQTTWTAVEEYVSPATSVTDGGLTSGTRYYYRVRATKGADVSAWATTSVTVAAASSTAATFVIPASTASRTFDATSATGFAGAAWKTVSGVTRLPQAGDIIELAAGTHGPFKFRNIRGTANSRITIRGPQTNGQRAIVRRVTPSAGGFVIEFFYCQHFNFDGYQPTLANTEAGAYQCGIKVTYATNATTSNLDNPSMWVKCTPVPSGGNLNPCKSYTMRYIEINGGWRTYNSFGAGFYPHSVDTAHQRTQYPGQWIAEDVVFEYNWTHWLRNGFYLGPNFIESGPKYPCLCRNMAVRYNRVEDIAGAGIHVKCWVEGTNSIHHNYNVRTGRNWEQFAGQQSNTRAGIDLHGCTADVYNNFIYDVGEGHTLENDNGIPNGLWFTVDNIPTTAFNGYGPYPYFTIRAWNNVVAKIARFGLVTYRSATTEPNTLYMRPYFYNNTIYDTYSAQINIAGCSGGWIRNNIALQGGGTPSYGGVSEQYNTVTGTPTNIFVSPSTGNFHLKAALLATGTIGTDIATNDLDENPRSAGSADRGAYEFTE